MSETTNVTADASDFDAYAILELEQGVGARPRPWPFPTIEEVNDAGEEHAVMEWSIGLPGTSTTQHELARMAAEDFVTRLRDEDERVHFEVQLDI